MGVSSLPKTVTRQRRDCDLNPGPSAIRSETTRFFIFSNHNDKQTCFDACTQRDSSRPQTPTVSTQHLPEQ